ncbi:MAG: endonuclease VII domain-containing protein [Nitrospiria bacterium]
MPKRYRDPDTVKNQQLKTAYGIGLKEFEARLRAQDGGCAICGTSSPTETGRRFLNVDHDHNTNVVRGLLCGMCNRGLGMFQESEELLFKAWRYLRQHRRSP